jgi:hypothetical protein
MAAPLNTCTTIEQRGVRFFVGKKYGCSKGYPQRNAAHMDNISLWISFAASIFFCPQKTHNATLFYSGTCIQGDAIL